MKILLDKYFRPNLYNRERWVAEKLEAIPPGSLILDVGCGGQPYRKYCSHLIYKAHDFGELDASKQIVGGRYGHIDYRSDICAIPEKDGAFDAVLCTEVIEHVPEPIKAIRELARLLKRQGILILTIPLGSFVHQAPYHFYGGFSEYWITRFLPESGFRNITVETNGNFFLYLGQECQRVCRILFRPKTAAKRVLMLPVEIMLKSVLTLTIPLLCYHIDKYVKTPYFTIGYHVTARKE